MPKETRNLVIAVIGDGYLYGASSDPRAVYPGYWRGVAEEEGFTLMRLSAVPGELAERLEAHGTSQQYFGDGYEALAATAPYLSREVQA